MADTMADRDSKIETVRLRFSLRGLMKLLFAVGIPLAILCLLAPAFIEPKEVWQRASCTHTLLTIGVALHQYHDDYGCFPPPCVASSNGAPMHSWRVLIAPYLQDPRWATGFLNQYDMSQPWNSPGNLVAARGVHCPYVCRSAEQPSPAEFTNYVLIVGKQAASDDVQSMTLDQITDGPANTVIVAEIANSDILWTEPRDLNIDDMSFQINDKSKPSISGNHPYGGHRLAGVVFADGTVERLDESTTPEKLRAMLTASAGDGRKSEE